MTFPFRTAQEYSDHRIVAFCYCVRSFCKRWTDLKLLKFLIVNSNDGVMDMLCGRLGRGRGARGI